ncbi:tyrosine-protein phosphatase [Rhodococcus oxybenzonivorans]|uniref:tyrosine-protein phosphatase n=1 Tax=Rhodococcus oxybenzonivorans TaxID=1990687 RepID=UPI002954C47F|nr:tyrosine-protein phosphatase [Rhodococcus oxybenzonivorans]MDV7352738.1 tyrosine-protein phosphatase [Rhodococcus oxybenzonivorans]
MIDAGISARDITGLVNLRDVGGLPMDDGGVTRAGVLYRSDAPRTGDTAPRHVPAWPPRVVVDLRSQREVKRSSCEWPGATTAHHHPLHDDAAPGVTPPADLPALYELILNSGAERIASLVPLVTRADGPVLVHCAAGKDRTGVVVAALLLAAGVKSAAVVADYLATAPNMAALQERWASAPTADRGRPPLGEQWFRTPEPAIVAVVERITAARGGAAGWLCDHGADRDDLLRWRGRLRA